MSNDKQQIKVSDVLRMLNEGKTRDDIAQEYGLSKADTKRLFLHPALKGKKTKVIKELPFEIVDDSEEMAQAPGPVAGAPEPASVEEGDHEEEE